jgi:hypothetical protein
VPNPIFDESGNFVLVPSLLGIKVINITTNSVSRIIGQPENTERFLALALWQGLPKKVSVCMCAWEDMCSDCAWRGLWPARHRAVAGPAKEGAQVDVHSCVAAHVWVHVCAHVCVAAHVWVHADGAACGRACQKMCASVWCMCVRMFAHVCMGAGVRGPGGASGLPCSGGAALTVS